MKKNTRNKIEKKAQRSRRIISQQIQKIKQTHKHIKDVTSIPYQDYLLELLKDPKEAAGYLNAALDSGEIKLFLLALHNVVQANGGITVLAAKTKKSRTSLYKSLSEGGNPYLKSANELLTAMDMHLMVVPNR